MSYKILSLAALLGGFLALGGCGSSGSTPQYTVTLSASPSEGGSVSPADSVYDEGADAEITATPNSSISTKVLLPGLQWNNHKV